jgi:acetyl esterase
LKVHPQLAAILARRAALGLAPYSAGTPAQARQAFATAQAALPKDRGAEVHAVADLQIAVAGGAITARRYQPTSEAPRARIVYFHGGGWVFGTLGVFDPVCRELAVAANAEVVSVDYRLAPEHPFPGPLQDALAALRALAVDGLPLAVMGDSAGGNLAAACTLLARRGDGPRIDLQALVYPIVDHDFERPSYREFGGGGFILSRADMEWFWRYHVPDPADRRNPLASPLYAPDLSGLPPAIVLVAGCDPLRDEGLAYAEALKAAGVSVDLRVFPNMTHGFFTMVGMLDPADVAVREAGAEIGRRLGSRGR